MWSLGGVNRQQETEITQNVIIKYATRNGNYSECDWSFRGLNIQQETGITRNVIDHYVFWTYNKKRELLRISLIIR